MLRLPSLQQLPVFAGTIVGEHDYFFAGIITVRFSCLFDKLVLELGPPFNFIGFALSFAILS